jgi:hypothetical protein
MCVDMRLDLDIKAETKVWYAPEDENVTFGLATVCMTNQ